MNWLERLLHLPPGAAAHGALTTAGKIAPGLLFLVFALLAVAIWYSYRQVTARTTTRAWQLVLGLRLALIGLLLFLLADPVLRSLHGREDVFTAFLVDTSRSMAVDDVPAGDGKNISRIDAARRLLVGADGKGGLLKNLPPGNKVVIYGFDENVRRISTPADLKAEGQFTNIYRGVRDMAAELQGIPVGAVVLLTDGGRNTGGTTQDAAALLADQGVPLFTVGLGNPRPPDDYEVVSVVAPGRVRRDTQVEVQVTIRHTGYPDPFEVSVSRAQTVIATRKIVPHPGTDLEQVKMTFTPDQEGTAVYKISVPPGKGEKNTANNSKEFTVVVHDDRLPVLYVEGSPRMEYRFLRHALFDDPDFRIVGLLRLGDNRFYVQGANESEAYLAKGFPTTVDQLYGFQAIILGDIEAKYFTPQQLTMLQDFVRVRGGGLLMLGGVDSFGLGGYASTPLADALPVQVTANDGPYSDEQFKARVTQDINSHPVMRLSLDPEANRVLWSQAPPLIGITPVGAVKPGALTLLTRQTDGKPVLAVQAYGAGRVAAFTSGGSWYWRVSVPSSVDFYEKFWKQLIRWLAVGARERLTAETDSDVYAPGTPVTIRASVLAKDLQPVDDASVVATVTDPLGNSEDVTLDWILSEEGVYQAQYTPPDDGDYRVAVRVEGWDVKPVEADFRVAQPVVESADTAMKEDALKEMARIGHGQYLTYDTAGKLPAELAQSGQGARFAGMKPEDAEIWDNPIFYLLIGGIMVLEWIVRRRSGLA